MSREQYSKKYYWKNREVRLRNNQTWRDNNKTRTSNRKRELRQIQVVDRLIKYQQERGMRCAICSYHKNWSALIWHHLDPATKKINIATYARMRRNWTLVESEIKKCVLLCANCHQELHYPHANIKE